MTLPAVALGEQAGRDFVAPQTEAEKLLARIWCAVLKVDRAGIFDDFYELGGHSITAVRVLVKINEAFGSQIELRNLLRERTIHGLQGLIGRKEGE